MARYEEQPIINRTESGKRFYSSVIPQTIEIEDSMAEYVSKLGDRWDNLAFRFYGNPAQWYVLANANGGLNGSIFIKPGTKIRIPEV